ncbi:distal tail protein Dit, partial [Muricomes intestini]|uniref:distal tail protein Dit n=1 Tax=Muricomes intestini TaxID=1796634 RepID=UPI002FDEF087
MSLSVKFNDAELNEYIDVMQGFTPFVGADWSPEINAGADNVKGAVFQYTTHKEKVIHMPFFMKYNLEEKYDTLQRILNVSEPKPLIFSNMPNKVFYAIPFGTLDFEEIVFLGKGEITWIIPDSVSYSTDIASVPATDKNGILTAHVNNDGSAEVYPIYRIKHVTENGYIGIVHPGGAFEMGNRDEADLEPYQQSEVLTKGMSDYVAYTGNNPKNPAILNNGTLNLASDGYLRLNSQGSGSHWHGGSRKWTLPADSNGDV